MKIVSWNLLHSVGATLEHVEQLIHHEKPDLMLMQETTVEMDRLPHRIGGHYARNPLPGRKHGLAAWSPLAFYEPPRPIALQPGLFVKRVSQIVMLDGFAIANVHLSHSQILNRRQLRRIADALPPTAAIIGDYNMVGPPLLPGFREVGPQMATHHMADMLPLRLDRCLARGLDCMGAHLLARIGSDHHPITIRLKPAKRSR